MSFIQNAVENKFKALKSAAGIEELSEFFEIGRETQGKMTTVLEICFEVYKGQYYIRLRTTRFFGSSASGRSVNSETWPIKDPGGLSDFSEITDAVVRAAAADATKYDPRGRIGKFIDRLMGLELINDLPELARAETKALETLHATIRRDKYGMHVYLCIEVKGRAPGRAQPEPQHDRKNRLRP